MWVLLDQVSWHIRFRPSAYLTALGTFSAAVTTIVSTVAAAGVLVYVILTYRLWQETRRTNEATLMSQLMVEYDNMRDAVRVVQDYYLGFSDRQQALEAFRQARVAPDQNNDIMLTVDPSRFRVSRFFVRVRKLSRAGFLSRRIILAALGRAAIQDVFLEHIDPLDQVISRLTYNRENITDRDFFRQLLEDRQKLQS
jgi:archaellum biogenesis ATPase FlaH